MSCDSQHVTLHVPLTAETKDPISEELLMKMQKGVTLINTACLEGSTRQTRLRFSVREQILLHLRGATQERRDSRIISIRVHRTALRHRSDSTSNAESVEVGEDASEFSCLREPVRSRTSSPLQVQQQPRKKEM